MNKYLILLLLISSEVFAIKAKITQDENIMKVRVFLKNVMISREEAKIKNKEIEYITDITAKVDGKTIFSISTSPFLSKNPILKFEFYSKSQNGAITFFTTNNKGIQKKGSIKFPNNKRSSIAMSTTKYTLYKNQRILNPKIWEATTPEEGIIKLYGSMDATEGQIKIKAPSDAENTAAIPINIQSDIDLESIAVFENVNPRSTIAIFNVPNGGIINYFIRIKMKRECGDTGVLVYAKDRKGILYKAWHEMYLSGGDMNCDGTSTGGGG